MSIPTYEEKHWFHHDETFTSGTIGTATLGSYSNHLLVAIVMATGDQTTSAVSFDGDSFTKRVTKFLSGTSFDTETTIWTLANPTEEASCNLSVTMSGSNEETSVILVSVSGADLSDPINSTGVHSGSNNSSDTVSITTTLPNCLMIGGTSTVNGATDVSSTDRTLLYGYGGTFNAIWQWAHGGGYYALGAPDTYTMQFNYDASAVRYVTAAIAINGVPYIPGTVWF